MTLGRIFRLDHKLRQDRSARWALTILLNGGAGFLFVLVAVESLRPSGDWRLMIPTGIFWLACATGVEYHLRWVQSFELRLLPDGVQLLKWGRTVTLIEPQIVGGRYLASFDNITLRSGRDRAMIHLSLFQKRADLAAILAHCSQFLSPEQQADFGQKWAALYYRLITPPKPVNARRMVLGCLVAYLAGGVVLVSVTEYLNWLYPDLVLRNGLPLRFQYLGWILFPLLVTGPPTFRYLFERLKVWRKQAVEHNIDKLIADRNTAGGL